MAVFMEWIRSTTLEDYRRICEDYRMFWCDDEEDIYEEKSTDLKTLEVWKET